MIISPYFVTKLCKPLGIILERYRLRNKIVKYLKSSLKAEPDQEKQEVLNFLKYNIAWALPYNYIRKYWFVRINVYEDAGCRMSYVLHEGKRIYFPRGWNARRVRKYYRGILTEQDPTSPHCYENGDFCVHDGDIVADAGAAEGIFALSVIEKALVVYLFECEEEWIEPLEKTFEPWKEKVQIVKKYISDVDNSDCTSLDTFLAGRPINFIKADIEGAEIALLRGAKELLSANGGGGKPTVSALHISPAEGRRSLK